MDDASAFPALDDLGIMQVCRRETLGCGLGPTFARDVQDNFGYAIHLQQGLSIVRQLITGKEGDIPATHSLEALEERSGALRITFAHKKRGHQALYRREG